MPECAKTTHMSTEQSENHLNPERWMAAYGRTLLRYTVTRVGDLDSAEDIIQETYASALGSIRYFKGACSEKTWLFSILKHKISDHFRSPKTRYRQITTAYTEQSPGCTPFGVKTASSNPCQEYETKELLATVYGAIAELPGPMALSFYLYELKGLPKDDICRLMGIRAGNFYVILSRARKRIRRHLQVRWFNA